VQNRFPDILVVVQVALEGAISRGAAQASLAAGQLPQGDLLPWMVAQQFQDSQFPGLSGARIVRIAAHPSVMGAGYGSKAMRELQKYYEGQYAGAWCSGDGTQCQWRLELFVHAPQQARFAVRVRRTPQQTYRANKSVACADAIDADMDSGESGDERRRRSADASTPGHDRLHANGADAHQPDGDSELLTEKVAPRDLSELPPLFTRLQERKAEMLHYLGVSFGLTGPLLKFWQKLGFAPVYLRQTASDVTGEHTCIVLKALAAADVQDTVRACLPLL
jgi:N-acetyltransferase 10